MLPASTPLPGDRPRARRRATFIRETLTGWEVEEDTLDTAELCVSELVTNAVIHTGTAAELTVQLDRRVADRPGARRRQARVGQLPAEPGRPADDLRAAGWAWWTRWPRHGPPRTSADGTTVWFEIERPPRRRLLPDEPAPQVRLQRLSDGGHVVGPEQVALDEAVEPVPAGVLLGAVGADDGVGGDLDLGALGGAVPDLGEAGVVRQQPLEGAVGLAGAGSRSRSRRRGPSRPRRRRSRRGSCSGRTACRRG